MLVFLLRSEATLPPDMVNRAPLRVIEEMYRLRAAALRNKEEAEVTFLMVTKGMPLSSRSRKISRMGCRSHGRHASSRLIQSGPTG